MRNDLLGCLITGSTLLQDFCQGSFADPAHLKNPLDDTKKFACGAVKQSVSCKKQKVCEITALSDLFGRLLHLAFGVSIDLQVILAYSFTPLPASLAHIDGSMYKTNKASLLKNL